MRMKKFTLMIVAALMAVTASAQKLDKAQIVSPTTNKVRMEAHSMPLKTKPVKPFKLNQKAHKAAPVSIDDLTGTWMQIYYSYFDEAFVTSTIEISKVNDLRISITGWWGEWTEPIEASVDLKAGTVTIEPQLIYEYEGDTSAELVNGTTEGAPLVGTIGEDGGIYFEDDWAAQLQGQEGFYEYGLYTMLVRPNGKMNYESRTGKKEVDVYIEQDEEEGYVYVFNFGNFGRMAGLQLNEDQTISVPSGQVIYYEDGDFVLYGYDGEYLVNLTATGTETTITFDQSWTGYNEDGYWLGDNSSCTIELTDGSTFTYPVEPEDVAATPATPTDLEYDVHPTYGPRIFVEVPRKDVDGNRLRKDKLFYQIYSMIDGTAYAYTLTASAYEKLESDLEVIPYDFTDEWDIYTEGDSKKVYLYGADGWEKVGVKSIYTGGGETHVSGIIWYNIADGTITVEEDTTGISQVNATEQNSGKAYNLAGQQVKQGYKGIVIKDGRKFMMK